MPVVPILGFPINISNPYVGDFPYWEDFANAWDDIEIAGIRGWGLVNVLVRKAHTVDTKNAPGATAPTMTHLGYEPSQVVIQIRMFTQDHWDTWVKAAPLFLPPSSPRKSLTAPSPSLGLVSDINSDQALANTDGPQPMDVTHPALSAHGIRSLYVLSVEPPHPSSTPGVFEAQIVAQEFKPKKKGNTTLTAQGSTDLTKANINKALGTKAPATPSTSAAKP